MTRLPPAGHPAARRQRGFSFLEVLLVIGIIGLIVACLVGFLVSSRREWHATTPIPAATPAAAPAATPAAPKAPAP